MSTLKTNFERILVSWRITPCWLVNVQDLHPNHIAGSGDGGSTSSETSTRRNIADVLNLHPDRFENHTYRRLCRFKMSRNTQHEYRKSSFMDDQNVTEHTAQISNISVYGGSKCYGIYSIKLFITHGRILNKGSIQLPAFETNIFYNLINTDFYSTNGNTCASYGGWVILVCGVTRLRTGQPRMWFSCW